MWIENVRTSLHGSGTGLLLQDRLNVYKWHTGIFQVQEVMRSSLRKVRVIKSMAAALGMLKTHTVPVGQCNTVGTSL